MTRDLTPLFDPSSIAIVGASDNPTKYGNWLAARALRDRRVRTPYLVNRSRATVLGEPTAPTLASLDAAIDLAVLAVPAAAFDDAVDDAITAGVRAVVAISGGLGERGGEGRHRERAAAARLRAAGITLLGPNCMGVLDNTTGLDATASEFHPGPVSLVSQSGNVAIDVAEHLWDAGIGVARFASLGNCADLDVADLVESCVDHEGTEAIAVYCEGFRDGRRFARAAARATAAGKPLVLLSVGRGAASSRAAASHTGSLVTSYVVLEAVCEATGAELVRTPREAADLLQALLRTSPPPGRRVAVIADGGGHASLAADGLEELGLRVEPFGADLAERIAAELPATATATNPIDLGGGGEQDITRFSRVAKLLVDAPEVDATLLTGFFGGYSRWDEGFEHQEEQTARAMAAVVADAGASFAVHAMFADSAAARALREDGVAVYRDLDQATWALDRIARRESARRCAVPDLPAAEPPLTATGYWPARRVLADAGVPFVAAAEVTTRSELLEAAQHLSFPLVLKALGDEHKSDRGGVVLGRRDRAALLAAWDRLPRTLAPPACSVEEQADLAESVELIVGVRNDAGFGPVVLAGLGGVYTELLRDTRCALGPVSAAQARGLLLSLRGSALLTGFRGTPPLDVDAAADLLVRLSHVAAAHPEIAEIECNPIAVSPQGAVALDARIILRPPDPHL